MNLKSKISQVWSFDKFKGDFQNHIEKSIPFYKTGHEIIIQASNYYLKNGSSCCDIGCSTGALLKKLNEHYTFDLDINFIGLDISKKMINLSRKNIKSKRVNFICGDYNALKKNEYDLIISYYTLQFIPKNYKKKFLKKVFTSLKNNSAFILFEKTTPKTVREYELYNSLYSDFKRSNHISPSEIIEKEISLRSILNLSTTKDLHKMLRETGFTKIIPLTKYLFFEGYIIFN